MVKKYFEEQTTVNVLIFFAIIADKFCEMTKDIFKWNLNLIDVFVQLQNTKTFVNKFV